MRHSAKIDAIAHALAIVQSRVAPLKRDAKNAETNSGYSSVEQVVSALREPMSAVGLSYSQDAPIAQVGPLFVVNVTTLLMHESGQWIEGTTQLNFLPGSAMQAAGVISFACRVGLAKVTGTISEHEDRDGQEQPEPEPVTETRLTVIQKAEKPTGIGEYFKQKFIADEQRFVCREPALARRISSTVGQPVTLSLVGYADGDVEIVGADQSEVIQ